MNRVFQGRSGFGQELGFRFRIAVSYIAGVDACVAILHQDAATWQGQREGMGNEVGGGAEIGGETEDLAAWMGGRVRRRVRGRTDLSMPLLFLFSNTPLFSLLPFSPSPLLPFAPFPLFSLSLLLFLFL